jgi:aryl-alcohol dehydrogenase-like predicted oxidoreductase
MYAVDNRECEENMAAADIELSPEQMAKLDAIAAP